jgi:hypothetical protein
MSVATDLTWEQTGAVNMPRVAWHDHSLWVEYTSGNIWRFDGVSRYEYRKLLAATDKPRYVARHVMGRYPAERHRA